MLNRPQNDDLIRSQAGAPRIASCRDSTRRRSTTQRLNSGQERDIPAVPGCPAVARGDGGAPERAGPNTHPFGTAWVDAVDPILVRAPARPGLPGLLILLASP